MPRVVITDYSFPSLEIEEGILKPQGCDVIGGQWKTPELLVPHMADADVVLTQFAPVKAEVIAAMKRARVIVRYGIGVDNVDLEAAKARGIPVCNVPDYCIDEVADHTLAFILATTRQVVPNCVLVRSGQWGLATPLAEMKTLCDLTVGLVGFGRIGREVAARLAPFKCQRLVFDPLMPAAVIEQAGCRSVTLPELLAEADIVSLHCPSTPQTRRMLNAESLSRMKVGSILINVARGDLIETPALVAALQSGKLAAAAIDVCDPEPIPADSALRSLGNVIVASHIASCSAKAARKLRETVAGIAAKALRGEPLPNVVNGVSQERGA